MDVETPCKLKGWSDMLLNYISLPFYANLIVLLLLEEGDNWPEMSHK